MQSSRPALFSDPASSRFPFRDYNVTTYNTRNGVVRFRPFSKDLLRSLHLRDVESRPNDLRRVRQRRSMVGHRVIVAFDPRVVWLVLATNLKIFG